MELQTSSHHMVLSLFSRLFPWAPEHMLSSLWGHAPQHLHPAIGKAAGSSWHINVAGTIITKKGRCNVQRRDSYLLRQ